MQTEPKNDSRAVFYRPIDKNVVPEALWWGNSVAGDFNPFYWNGEYHVFFLRDFFRVETRIHASHTLGMLSTDIYHVATRDFVHFDDWDVALPQGAFQEQDWCVCGGSILEKDGQFHYFYCGDSPYMTRRGDTRQAVLHAVSHDLRTWEKDRSFHFAPPLDTYRNYAWRDPFVFWNDEAHEYWMLIGAAKKAIRFTNNRGCIALAASKDLKTWEVREPFYEPDSQSVHECPDLFRIGDWWYLIHYGGGDRGNVTSYRMSKSLKGPWLAGATDTLDGNYFCAAKTASDGKRRFAFGWIPTRDGDKDSGKFMWGGDLVVHEIVQRKDGSLISCMPEALAASFKMAVTLAPKQELGDWKIAANTFQASAVSRFSALSFGVMPDPCLIETNIRFRAGSRTMGLLLRVNEKLTGHYRLLLDARNQRLVLDHFPGLGDQNFMVERPLKMLPDQPIHLRVIVAGSILVAYANDEVALTCRIYDHAAGKIGLCVTEGEVTFENTSVKIRP